MLSERPWKPDAVLRLTMWMLLSISFGGLVVMLLFPKSGGGPAVPPNIWAIIIGTLALHGVAFLLTWLLLSEHQIGWREAFGFAAPRRLRAGLLAIVTTVGLLPVAMGLGHLSAVVMQALDVTPVAQPAVRSIQAVSPLWEKVVLGALTILVAPVVEEILFRGILYPVFKQARFPVLADLARWAIYPWLKARRLRRTALWVRGVLCPKLREKGFPFLAAGGTSLFFAVTHANVMTLVPLFVLALVLTWLYEATDNLLAPILAHCLFNTANFIFLLSAQRLLD